VRDASDVSKDTVERRGHPGEVQRLGKEAGVLDLPAGASAHEALELRRTGPSPLRRLPLEPAQRSKLTLNLDHLLYRGDTERADQFVLQVSDAHEETELFQVGAGKMRTQASPFEAAPETALRRLVAQTRQPDVEPPRAEQIQEMPDVRRTPHRHDRDTLAVKITTAARGERFEGELITDPLDKHNRIRAGGRVPRIGCCSSQCGVPAASHPGSSCRARPRLMVHVPQSRSSQSGTRGRFQHLTVRQPEVLAPGEASRLGRRHA
jgi:hypothetical protein